MKEKSCVSTELHGAAQLSLTSVLSSTQFKISADAQPAHLSRVAVSLALRSTKPHVRRRKIQPLKLQTFRKRGSQKVC